MINNETKDRVLTALCNLQCFESMMFIDLKELLSETETTFDVNSGIGVIVVALAAIIIGEVIFKDMSFTQRLVCVIFGAIIYRLLLVGVLKLNIIGANDFKLVSALVIALFLTLPQLKLRTKRKGVK